MIVRPLSAGHPPLATAAACIASDTRRGSGVDRGCGTYLFRGSGVGGRRRAVVRELTTAGVVTDATNPGNRLGPRADGIVMVVTPAPTTARSMTASNVLWDNAPR